MIFLNSKYIITHKFSCTGQNKNRYMIQYLVWRALQANYSTQKFSLNFMLTGHTKFSPDRHFGHIKREINKTDINTVYDLENAVNSSSRKNVAELVGHPNGVVVIPTYDWKTYFDEVRGREGWRIFPKKLNTSTPPSGPWRRFSYYPFLTPKIFNVKFRPPWIWISSHP